jgi:hypothetical protein
MRFEEKKRENALLPVSNIICGEFANPPHPSEVTSFSWFGILA